MEAKEGETMHPPPVPRFTKKRSLDVSHLQNQPYYKIRSLLKDARPHFLEVLRTPDFRNCKAASEICEKLKVLLDLHKEMTAATINVEKLKSVSNLHRKKVMFLKSDKLQIFWAFI